MPVSDGEKRCPCGHLYHEHDNEGEWDVKDGEVLICIACGFRTCIGPN